MPYCKDLIFKCDSDCRQCHQQVVQKLELVTLTPALWFPVEVEAQLSDKGISY